MRSGGYFLVLFRHGISVRLKVDFIAFKHANLQIFSLENHRNTMSLVANISAGINPALVC